MIMPINQKCPKCGQMFMGSDCIGRSCNQCKSYDILLLSLEEEIDNMKLEEVKKEYQLYLDIDGVFANFDKWCEETFDLTPKDNVNFWNVITDWVNENPDKLVWGDLELMPDAMELWNYVKDKTPIFLSSTGTRHETKAIEEKHNWINKYFPDNKLLLVNRSRFKAQWADKNSILIDDRMKSIKPWRDAGGIGILHTNAKDTIKELKKLGV